MQEFFNWHDTTVLFTGANWFWFVLAFILGVWIGYKTCVSVGTRNL